MQVRSTTRTFRTHKSDPHPESPSRPDAPPALPRSISAPNDAAAALPTLSPAASQRRLGILLVLVSGVSFGAIPVFARAAYASGAGTSSALLVRFGLAAACMLALMAVRRTPFPRGRDLGALVALGSVIYVGQSLTYFIALRHTAASVASLVLYVYPALVAVFSAAFLQYPLTRPKALAIGLSLAGCGLTVGPLRDANVLGIGLAFASALTYASYVIMGNRLAGRAGAVASTTVLLGSTAASYAVIVAATGPQWPQAAAGWWALVGLSLVSTVVAVLTFLAGTRRVGPVAASTIATVEPIIAVILATLFLGETLGALQALGGALIFIAVLIIARP